MANLVLYRKYRPKTFKEVIGQEHIVKTLTNAIFARMISHAYLFSGPKGSGKTTIARLLAKAINCQKNNSLVSDFEPCNQCSACQEINQGKAVDLVEIDAASHRGIDQIRELKEGISFAPNKLKYKVYIIDESHQLTSEAANALLKTLEEPPSHAIFILATTEPHKMPATIISRCQRFDFRKFNLDQIKKRISQIAKLEKVQIDDSALELIAINSEGSLRDAESILDQVLTFCQGKNKKKIEAKDIKELLGLIEIQLVSKFFDFILKKETQKALSFIDQLSKEGHNLYEFNKALISYLRQALITKINPESFDPLTSGLTKDEFEKLKEQISQITQEDLCKILEIFLESENKMRYTSLPQLPLELGVVEILEKIG